MTQDQIDAIKQARKEHYIDMPVRHRAEIQTSQIELMKTQAQCDHKHPDGTSSVIEARCSICQGMALPKVGGLRLRVGD